MRQDITEQEQDPAGVKPYDYDYERDDWLDTFREEMHEPEKGRSHSKIYTGSCLQMAGL
jgi:hypothetical protein